LLLPNRVVEAKLTLSPESAEHNKIKTAISEKLKVWTGATLQEYPSSGHELDVYAMTPEGISVYVEIIWSSSKNNFFRDLNLLQTSDAKVKLVVASPEIISKKSCRREFEKVVIAQRKLGIAIHGNLIDGLKIIQRPKYMENDFKKIFFEMLDHARKCEKAFVEEAGSQSPKSAQADHGLLMRICTNQAKRSMAIYKGDVQSLYKKFVPELYVIRHEVESIFNDYVESSRVFEGNLDNYKLTYQKYEKELIVYEKEKAEYDEKVRKARSEGIEPKNEEPRRPLEPVRPKAYHCIAFVGEAGIGKTNFLIGICDQLLEKKIPALFYVGHTLTENFESLLLSDLSSMNKDKMDLIIFLDSLNKTLRYHDDFLIIILDAINESRNYRNIEKEIVNFLEKLENLGITRIKLMISCRDIEWSTIASELGNLNERIFQGAPVHLGKLSDDELREMWEKYRIAYDLKTASFESLSSKILNIIDQPLMLRFLCEAYRGDYLPRDIERLDIFERYWERKLCEMERIGSELGIMNLKSNAMSFIFQIVQKMRELRQWELLEYEAEKLTGEKAENYESVFARLLSEHIILYSRTDVRIRAKLIGFTYEAFFEYVLAKLVYLKNSWISLSEDEILSQFRTLVQESYEYRPMKGALGYLILFFSRDEESRVYLEMLKELVKTDKGCEIAYEVISRLKVINANVFRILKEIIVTTTGPRTIFRSWGKDHVATEILSNISDSCMIEVFSEWENWVSHTYNMLHANTLVVGFAELARDRPEKALKMLALIFSDERFRWCRASLTPIFLRLNSLINEDAIQILLYMASGHSRFPREIPLQFIRSLPEKLRCELPKYVPRFYEQKNPEAQELLLDIIEEIGKNQKEVALAILNEMKGWLAAPNINHRIVDLSRILGNSSNNKNTLKKNL